MFFCLSKLKNCYRTRIAHVLYYGFLASFAGLIVMKFSYYQLIKALYIEPVQELYLEFNKYLSVLSFFQKET